MLLNWVIVALCSWLGNLWPRARHPAPWTLGGADPGQSATGREDPSPKGTDKPDKPSGGPQEGGQPGVKFPAHPGDVKTAGSPPASRQMPDGRQPTHAKNDEEHGKQNGVPGVDTPEENSSGKVGQPIKAGGRRGPQPKNPQPEPSHPSFRPELVCRKLPGSACWEVILTVRDEDQPAVEGPEGALLFTDGECRVPSLKGRLIVSSQDKQEHVVPLFEGDPLIFKLQKDWAGEGRRVARITKGYFIVFAPTGWKRTGREPVEPDGCADSAFQAHYFHRDATASDETVGSFFDLTGPLVGTGIELAGRRVFDDSDEGDLFVGDAPTLKSPPGTVRARVGEETARGWGETFLPSERPLQKVLGDREGRFFLRVYNSEVRMLDSVAFRYLRDLTRIEVDGAAYGESTVLVPTETGYRHTQIRFIDANGSSLTPALPRGAHQAVRSGAIVVPPQRNADHVTCSLGSGASAVKIVLDLPRIWWRLEDGCADPGAWRDTPLVMTREEFRNHADANSVLSILSKRQSAVRAGFEDRPEQPYSRTIENDHIAIPLTHFVDHTQITGKLTEDAHFCVEWAGEKLSVIRVSADPAPEILAFTSDPPTIVAGQEAVLRWVTRNAQGIRARIDPVIRFVESTGSVRVEPVASTHFTLRLMAPGIDDITKGVSVTVVQNSGELMTPMQLSEKVVEMQHGAFLEYYRGHLGSDTTGDASRLRKATQYWERQKIIALVQELIEPENHAYFAVRTSNPITQNCIDNARILHINRMQ